jgi:hypothetical protein
LVLEGYSDKGSERREEGDETDGMMDNRETNQVF